jgi:hypothetical protein
VRRGLTTGTDDSTKPDSQPNETPPKQ